MKDTVLCAIDFSEASGPVLKRAMKEAKRLKSHLTVLYSYRLLQSGKLGDIVSFRKQTEEDAVRKYKELEKKVINGEPLPHSFVTQIGFISDCIESYLQKNSVNTVVVSETLGEEIYNHKGLSLEDFQKSISARLLVVTDAVGLKAPHITNELKK